MSGRAYSTQAPERAPRPVQRPENLNIGASNASAVGRAEAIEKLRAWLGLQFSRVSNSPIMTQIRDTDAVLAFLENAWFEFETTGVLPALSTTPPNSMGVLQSRIALPLELVGEVRPLIDLTEPSYKPRTSIDWNARLGIPEYRTQSDNLAAPEATCNTTTLAMILERLGYSREDLIVVMEKRFGITDANADEKTQVWEQKSRTYINSVMNDSAAYRRIRGTSSVSRDDRAGLAKEFREQAQLEDLIDMLLKDMGISRYGVISEPTKFLEELSGENAGNTEIIWNSNWSSLSEKVRNCLENGGAAALSFKHKGTRAKASHIVAVLSVESDGFKVDDPYGDVREDYNPRKWDDAYWSRNSNGDLRSSRDVQKNEQGDFDDWGVDWMVDLPDSEEKGKESFLTTNQITKGFKYVQLFHRPKEEE